MLHAFRIPALFLPAIIVSLPIMTFARISGSRAPVPARIDSLVIHKSIRKLDAYSNGQRVLSYQVCLGPQPVGPKHFRNDGRTPEGLYFVNGKNPASHYHKCLGISYPSKKDVLYAARNGRPAGGDIKIHGLPNGKGYMTDEYRKVDWTLGCIALTDSEMDELYERISVGTPVNILP